MHYINGIVLVLVISTHNAQCAQPLQIEIIKATKKLALSGVKQTILPIIPEMQPLIDRRAATTKPSAPRAATPEPNAKRSDGRRFLHSREWYDHNEPDKEYYKYYYWYQSYFQLQASYYCDDVSFFANFPPKRIPSLGIQFGLDVLKTQIIPLVKLWINKNRVKQKADRNIGGYYTQSIPLDYRRLDGLTKAARMGRVNYGPLWKRPRGGELNRMNRPGMLRRPKQNMSSRKAVRNYGWKTRAPAYAAYAGRPMRGPMYAAYANRKIYRPAYADRQIRAPFNPAYAGDQRRSEYYGRFYGRNVRAPAYPAYAHKRGPDYYGRRQKPADLVYEAYTPARSSRRTWLFNYGPPGFTKAPQPHNEQLDYPHRATAHGQLLRSHHDMQPSVMAAFSPDNALEKPVMMRN